MSAGFVGVGLRPTHYPFIESALSSSQTIHPQWFEAISENYMDSEGRPLDVLLRVRERYPVALHGVSLSIGSTDPLNESYLSKLKQLVERVNPFLVSDHLCWTGAHGQNLHDLLPIPFTKSTLEHVSERVDRVQNYLGRSLTLENVSTYVGFRDNELEEWSFLSQLSAKTGCTLLLDINNLFVNSQNYGFDPYAHLNAVDLKQVAQVHLAGFTDMGDFLFDTHSKPVFEQVWQLFAHFISKKPDTPVLIEWDEDIPEFAVLEQEVLRAQKICGSDEHPPKPRLRLIT